MGQGEVYFEFVQVGRLMRVVAVDADSGIEVIVVTPLAATKLQMQQVALAKLRKRLSGVSPPPPSPGKFA